MKIATKLWGFVLFPHVVLKWRKYAINYSPIFTYEKLGWIMAKRNETKQIGKENISTYCTVRCESECFELWSLERHLSCASQLGLLVFITTHTNAHLQTHRSICIYILGCFRGAHNRQQKWIDWSGKSTAPERNVYEWKFHISRKTRVRNNFSLKTLIR